MIKKHLVETLAGIFFSLAIFGLVHQKLATVGGWFCWEQFWHHETLIILCGSIAMALLIGKYASRPRDYF